MWQNCDVIYCHLCQGLPLVQIYFDTKSENLDSRGIAHPRPRSIQPWRILTGEV